MNKINCTIGDSEYLVRFGIFSSRPLCVYVYKALSGAGGASWIKNISLIRE